MVADEVPVVELLGGGLEKEMNRQKPGQGHGESVGKGHEHHPAVEKANQGRQRGGQKEQERGLPVRGRDARDVGSGVDGDRQQVKDVAGDDVGVEGLQLLVDVDAAARSLAVRGNPR